MKAVESTRLPLLLSAVLLPVYTFLLQSNLLEIHEYLIWLFNILVLLMILLNLLIFQNSDYFEKFIFFGYYFHIRNLKLLILSFLLASLQLFFLYLSKADISVTFFYFLYSLYLLTMVGIRFRQ